MKYWRLIMDERYNPLRGLPVAVRYQIMTVLALMWSTIFCAMVSVWHLFEGYVLGHVVLLTVGCVITNFTFRVAERAGGSLALRRIS